MDTERALRLLMSFTVAAKHARFEELLRSKRGRFKVVQSLDHFGDLDARFCTKLQGQEQSMESIHRLLIGLGAPTTCYVVSSNSELDAREAGLAEMLTRVVGGGCGSFLCLIPGRLAYFEGESPNERFLCRKS